MRDKKPARARPYPLGSIPHEIIVQAAKLIVYKVAVGQPDIGGDTWASIFASAVGGEHLGAPLGLADIVRENCCWSAKTIQHENPYKTDKLRLIVGRNSPEHSFGISNPMADIEKTGQAVLNIWNERVDIAANEHEDIRMIVLIRDMDGLRFSLFESEINRFVTADYSWKKNKRGNLEGYNKADGNHEFTWQPHGSQFTLLRRVPGSATRFSIRRPGTLDFDRVMNEIGFEEDWVTVEYD